MKNQNVASKRAKLTKTGVIDARSLGTSHKRLAEILKPGMTVLDVGCGTGAITSGIAEIVGENGRVIGIDNNPSLIETARQTHKYPWLSFEVGDIYNLPFNNEFDIVTSARVLQWLSEPQAALNMMIKATKINGRVLILDYNHAKISWTPSVPKSMQHFYQSFLSWRSDAGMDNEIADHLPKMFKSLNLSDVFISPQHEETNRTDSHFEQQVGIWAEVAEFKGKQMVEDGFLQEHERKLAVEEYREWIKKEANSQTMYLMAIEGVKEGV